MKLSNLGSPDAAMDMDDADVEIGEYAAERELDFADAEYELGVLAEWRRRRISLDDFP